MMDQWVQWVAMVSGSAALTHSNSGLVGGTPPVVVIKYYAVGSCDA